MFRAASSCSAQKKATGDIIRIAERVLVFDEAEIPNGSLPGRRSWDRDAAGSAKLKQEVAGCERRCLHRYLEVGPAVAGDVALDETGCALVGETQFALYPMERLRPYEFESLVRGA